MAWIESHQELLDHPKVLKLMSKTSWSLDETIGKLHRFWWWALKYAEDGDLSRYDPAQYLSRLGEGMSPSDLLSNFQECGFIDHDLKIHDWIDYAGLFLTKKYSTSNPDKLKVIWNRYGYKYGKGKGKYGRVIANTKRTLSELKANIPNQPNLTKPNLTKPKTPPTPPLGDGFDRFWEKYPKKKSKGQAERAWKKLKPGEPLQDRILDAIERAKTSDQWCRDQGKFIPYPATWLNGKRWEDEPDPPVTATPIKPSSLGILADWERDRREKHGT